MARGFVALGLLAWSAGCARSPAVVARVGDTVVTALDLEYRQAVITIRSGRKTPEHLALLQLLEEGLMAEVGRSYGVVAGEQMLADEAARVAATTRDTAMLARVRAVFGSDEAAYRRLFLHPILVNQMLHARFSLGHDIQAEPLARAKQALADAQADVAPMAVLAARYGGEHRTLEFAGGRLRHAGPPAEPVPSALAPYGVTLPDHEGEFVEKVVAGLMVGRLHPKVVEDRSTFMVVRLTSRAADDARLEAAVFAKLPFDPWFESRSLGVPLSVSDSTLRRALAAGAKAPYITDRLAAE